MVAEPLVVEFRESQRAPVVEHMAAMAAGGRGWLNLTPGLDVDEPPPPRSPLVSLLTARGPIVPLATWTPASRRDPASAGIHHGEGPKAADMLAERGAPVPEGWRVLQDHPKRGLVVVPTVEPTAEGLDTVLAWLLRATGALCPVRRTGEWRALCYEVD